MRGKERVEHLVDRLLDDESGLSKLEQEELNNLLQLKGEYETIYRTTADTEVLLRGLREGADMGDQIMAQIEREFGPKQNIIFGLAFRQIAQIAAVVTFGILFLTWYISSDGDNEIPSLVQSSGAASVIRDGKTISILDARPLRPSDRLVTQGKTQVLWQYEDGTQLNAGSATEIVISPDLDDVKSESKCMRLLKGSLVADVKPQDSSTPLIIDTPHGQAIVRGTRFKLLTRESNTRLVVESGIVDLKSTSGQVISVEAGESAVVSSEELELVDERIQKTPLVRYTFERGFGETVLEREETYSGFDLKLTNEEKGLDWSPEGLVLDGENFLISSSTSEPIVEACKKTKEFTIEAWITPALESQGGPARIVTLTRGSSAHAILIAQGAFQIAPTTGFIARTPTDAADGTRRPPLSTRSSPAELTHIVFCHAKDGSRILYVNGEAVDQDHLPGDFSNWPIEFPLSIGGDLEGPNQGGHSRAWKGVIHFAALFDSALTEGEVRQNYKAGPGH